MAGPAARPGAVPRRRRPSPPRWSWPRRASWSFGRTRPSPRSRSAAPSATAMTDPTPQDEEEASLFEAPPVAEQERMVEAILFASAEPVSVADMNARMPHGADAARAVEALRRRYEGRGVQVVRVGANYA